MQTQAALGWNGPDKVEIITTNRAAVSVVVGDQLMLDNRRTDVDSTSNMLGLATAGIANAITPVATVASDLSAGIFGIAQTSAADNARLRLRLKGFCDAVRVTADVVLATDDSYGAITASRAVTKLASLDITSASTGRPRKVTFIPLVARTGAGTTEGWYDGINGFGYVVSIT